MNRGAAIHVEVAYAEPERVILKFLRMDPTSTVADALRRAAEDADFEGIDLTRAPVGIFGRLVRREQGLRDGDRVEIYRPLSEDPKAARRARAQQASRKPNP